jgi:hypothetical protein
MTNENLNQDKLKQVSFDHVVKHCQLFRSNLLKK